MEKVALIFGGSRGIGHAIAKKFYVSGCDTFVSSRDVNHVNEIVNSLKIHHQAGAASIRGLQCDITQEDSVKNVFEKVSELSGTSPDFVINSAGINIDSLLAKATREEMDAIISTNLIGSMLTSKHAVRHMLQQRKGGCILCIGSIVGFKGRKGQSIYAASKAALVGLTKSLAREVASRNIRVNLVEPGFIQTDMTSNSPGITEKTIPLGRFGQPEEVAEVVYFLCRSTYITGQVLKVDGGLDCIAAAEE